jgi:hypothetical protein
VRRREAAGRPREDVEDLRARARPLGQPPPERDAVDVLHGDEDLALEGPGVVNGDDVLVGELGQRLRLAQQPGLRARGVASNLGVHQLEGDLALQHAVVGRVHFAHAAPTEDVEDGVATDGAAAREGASRDARARLGVAVGRSHGRGEQVQAPRARRGVRLEV